MRIIGLALFWISALAIGAEAFAEQIPESWYGTWRGPTRVLSSTSRAELEGAMFLEIAPKGLGRLSWRIQYSGEGVRDYELLLVDEKLGQYVLDEKNGILIDYFYVGGVLYSQFEINGRRFTAQTELRDGKLFQDSNGFSAYPARAIGGFGVPSVRCSWLLTYQRAVLEKVGDGR